MALYAAGLAIVAAAVWMFGPALLPAKNIDTGIAINASAPTRLTLLDSNGAPTTLATQMGENGLVLVLVRSAEWCPFCKAQLKRTKEIEGPLKDRGYAVASLSYDNPAILSGFAQDHAIGYAMLSDPGSAMIKALGLRDPQYEKGSFAYGVPYAAILVINRDGVVGAKFVSADYRQRPTNQDVLAMVDGMEH